MTGDETTALINQAFIGPAPPLVAPKLIGERGDLSSRRLLWILLAITVLAGGLRFALLDRPPLYIDECFTFWRTCGSYGDLVETLRDDGFVPLHYEMLWWIKQGLPIGRFRLFPHGLFLTPIVMRFFPAVCGTLMIPVIYFVSRQLFDRWISVLASGFVACSAYATFFSRDAKMYMPAWMLGTLSVGCLLWWLRTGRSTAWLAWIAAGAAAGGVHVVTLLLLALAPIFLLTSRRMRWPAAVMILVGAVFIVAGPAGYYLTFNQWTAKSGGLIPGAVSEPNPDANWEASGLNWIPNQDGPSAAFESFTTYLTAFEWDGEIKPNDWDQTPPGVRRIDTTIVTIIIGLLILGMLPWPMRWRAGGGVTLQTSASQWRAALWLLCWIILPAYGFFYCRSYPWAGQSPGDWLQAIAGLWGKNWFWLAAATVILAAIGMRWRAAAISLAALVILFLGSLLVLLAIGDTDLLQKLIDYRTVHWLALICIPSAIWIYSGETLGLRFLKLGRMILVVGIILLLCAAANSIWIFLRMQARAAHPELRWETIWHTRYIGIVWPAIWIGAAVLVSRLPTRPLRWIAILVIAIPNLANGIAKYAMQTQVPYDRVFADVWLARDGAAVRTYFDLNVMPFGESGLPAGDYWRPMVAYSAVLAGRHETTPTEFRSGKTWPFQYGPVMEWFERAVVYRPFAEPNSVAGDMARSPEIQRIIIWKEQSLARTSAKDYLNRLGTDWQLVNQEGITARWYWTWAPRASFTRLEFARAGSSASRY